MKIFLIITTTILFFTFGNLYSADNTKLDISIDLNNSILIQKEVFGINGNMSSGPGNFDDAEFITLFTKLGSPYIRFPGGTVANLYDWETGRYKKNPKGIEKHNKRVPRKNTADKRNNKRYDTKSFLKCIKQSDASFAIVLNICMETPQNTMKWMQYIKSQGHTVSKVELGNELYFPGYEKCYPNPMEYINAAKKHSIAVKKIFPECKIGLIISSIPYSTESFIFGSKDDLSGTSSHREKRAADWDNAAMKSDFHDAVVIHMYARVGVKGNAKLNHPNLDVLKAYKYALVYNDIRYPKVISQIKKNYPGKNIWITEYNIKSVVLKKPSNLSTTYLGRLFTSEFLLKMFSTRKLTAANWHNITRFVKYKKGKFEIAEAFDFLALFNKAVDKCQKTTAVTINGNKYFADKQIKIENADKVKHPEVRGTFFFGSKSGYLFLINRFGTTYTINSLTILQKNIRPVAISTIIPKSTDIIALKSKKHKIEHRKLKSLKNLIIKPYSINRIQLDYKN